MVGWSIFQRFNGVLDALGALEHELISADADLKSGKYFSLEASSNFNWCTLSSVLLHDHALPDCATLERRRHCCLELQQQADLQLDVNSKLKSHLHTGFWSGIFVLTSRSGAGGALTASIGVQGQFLIQKPSTCFEVVGQYSHITITCSCKVAI